MFDCILLRGDEKHLRAIPSYEIIPRNPLLDMIPCVVVLEET